MKELFKDLLSIGDVQAVILFSSSGERLFLEDKQGIISDPSRFAVLFTMVKSLNEMDVIYSNRRVYIRRAGSSYIVVVMERFADSAMVKLNCDVLIPELKKLKRKKGIMAQLKNLKI